MTSPFEAEMNEGFFSTFSWIVEADPVVSLGTDLNNKHFLTFPACFLIPIVLSNLNFICSHLLDMRNIQEQVKKAFCYQNMF